MSKAKSVFATTFITTAMVLFFKIFGFIRQAVIASYFGATEIMDSYFLASEFVGSMSRTIVMSLSFATIGVYNSTKAKLGDKQASDLICSVFTILMVLSFIVVLAMFVFAPRIARLLAPSYTDEQVLRLAFLIKLTSFSFAFMAIQLICNSVLDAEGHFFLPRMQSFITNIIIILFCVLFARIISVYSLVVGQYVADIMYCIMLIWGIRKFVRIRFALPGKETLQIIKLTLPLLIGNGMIQLNELVDKSISSGLGEGAVSALSYCHTLTQFVTGVMIVNIGNVLFAHFSMFVTEKRNDKVAETLKSTLNIITDLLLPISLITFICAEDIVDIVYHRGTFTADDVILTSTIVKGYAISFVFVGIRDILTKSMYAFQNTRSPMINGSLSIVLNIILSIVLSRYIGILGIALGTSIAVVVTMLLNIRSFRKIMPEFSFRSLIGTAVKNIPAMVLLAIWTEFIHMSMESSLVSFLLASAIGLPLYFLILVAFKEPEVVRFVDSIKSKYF